jgi:AraC-like DNA-binding protein
MTPGKFVEMSRLETVRHRLEQTNDSVDVVASKCGYSTLDGLRVAFDRNLGVTPRGYRARFSQITVSRSTMRICSATSCPRCCKCAEFMLGMKQLQSSWHVH